MTKDQKMSDTRLDILCDLILLTMRLYDGELRTWVLYGALRNVARQVDPGLFLIALDRLERSGEIEKIFARTGPLWRVVKSQHK